MQEQKRSGISREKCNDLVGSLPYPDEPRWKAMQVNFKKTPVNTTK
jgi:hypothetical protein